MIDASALVPRPRPLHLPTDLPAAILPPAGSGAAALQRRSIFPGVPLETGWSAGRPGSWPLGRAHACRIRSFPLSGSVGRRFSSTPLPLTSATLYESCGGLMPFRPAKYFSAGFSCTCHSHNRRSIPATRPLETRRTQCRHRRAAGLRDYYSHPLFSRFHS
jgi:hypothetical protein